MANNTSPLLLGQPAVDQPFKFQDETVIQAAHTQLFEQTRLISVVTDNWLVNHTSGFLKTAAKIASYAAGVIVTVVTLGYYQGYKHRGLLQDVKDLTTLMGAFSATDIENTEISDSSARDPKLDEAYRKKVSTINDKIMKIVSQSAPEEKSQLRRALFAAVAVTILTGQKSESQRETHFVIQALKEEFIEGHFDVVAESAASRFPTIAFEDNPKKIGAFIVALENIDSTISLEATKLASLTDRRAAPAYQSLITEKYRKHIAERLQSLEIVVRDFINRNRDLALSKMTFTQDLVDELTQLSLPRSKDSETQMAQELQEGSDIQAKVFKLNEAVDTISRLEHEFENLVKANEKKIEPYIALLAALKKREENAKQDPSSIIASIKKGDTSVPIGQGTLRPKIDISNHNYSNELEDEPWISMLKVVFGTAKKPFGSPTLAKAVLDKLNHIPAKNTSEGTRLEEIFKILGLELPFKTDIERRKKQLKDETKPPEELASLAKSLKTLETQFKNYGEYLQPQSTKVLSDAGLKFEFALSDNRHLTNLRIATNLYLDKFESEVGVMEHAKIMGAEAAYQN